LLARARNTETKPRLESRPVVETNLMSKNTLGHYLADLGFLLKQEALDAKARAARETGEPGHQFALGRALAYYEVLSLMHQQAKAFGVDAKDLSLHDFDPDRDLLSEMGRK
jgi:hypothetical protein